MTNAKNNPGVAIETCTVATCEPGETHKRLSTLFFSSTQPHSFPSRMSPGTPDLACSFTQPCWLATALFVVLGDGMEGHRLTYSLYIHFYFFQLPRQEFSSPWLPGLLAASCSFLRSGEALGSACREQEEQILFLQSLAWPSSMHCQVLLAFFPSVVEEENLL